VARVAGLLAIAVLGMVMVHLFSHSLNERLAALGLPADVIGSIQSDEVKLAAITVPDALDAAATAKLRASVDQAFVFGFRVILLICVGLSVASSGVAWRMIGARTSPRHS
jgi:hypothetical protein